MRSLIRLGIIAAAVAFGYGSAHAVQGPPPGTYRASCANIQMRNWTLYANCQDTEGRWRSAVLPYVGDCVGDVSNINGQLRCSRRNDWRERDSLPRGSYAESCREIRMRGDLLTARCQSMSGRWMRTSLDNVGGCVGEVVNDDGQLQCGRRGWQESGSFVRTCAPIYVRGDDLRAKCQTGDGRWVWTTLDGFDRCGGRIININGQLRCGDRDRDDWDRDADRWRDRDRDGDRDNDRDRRLPRGTYTQSCQNIEVRGDRLHARCQAANGRWNWTDLDDFRRCREGISNIDGRLVCD
jgi:hypothetical protein